MSTQADLLRTVEILIKQLTIADQNFTTINDQLIIIKEKFEAVESDIKMLKILEERLSKRLLEKETPESICAEYLQSVCKNRFDIAFPPINKEKDEQKK